MNNKERSTQGQSLVEFSISAVFILLLLAGIVDFGRAFFSYMALRDAAQEGAAHGSAFPTDCASIRKRVRDTSRTPVDLQDTTNVQVSVVAVPSGEVCESMSPSSACEGNGNAIRVTVSYNFPVTAPFLGAIIGAQSFTLAAQVTDIIIRPPCP